MTKIGLTRTFESCNFSSDELGNNRSVQPPAKKTALPEAISPVQPIYSVVTTAVTPLVEIKEVGIKKKPNGSYVVALKPPGDKRLMWIGTFYSINAARVVRDSAREALRKLGSNTEGGKGKTWSEAEFKRYKTRIQVQAFSTLKTLGLNSRGARSDESGQLIQTHRSLSDKTMSSSVLGPFGTDLGPSCKPRDGSYSRQAPSDHDSFSIDLWEDLSDIWDGFSKESAQHSPTSLESSDVATWLADHHSGEV